MSVYNETESEVLECMQSLLAQTYADFEILIVNDDPASEANRTVLAKIAEMDSRIRILHNEKNIGLALSMNYAAQFAKGRYLARMDADDVCMPTRLEKEYAVISKGEYDLVCSGFLLIDENSNEITEKNAKSFFHTPENIRESLPYKSVIHHPTVIMTREIFERVGGYRDFPCSQDYDMWLRLLTAGARFYMIPEELLKYRIRGASISATKRLRQKLTLEYIRDLYVERLKRGTDSFSVENYQNYLKKHIKNEAKQMAWIDRGDVHLEKSNRLIASGKKTSGNLLKLYVTMLNPVYRHVFTKLFIKKQQIKYLQRKSQK